MINKTLKILSAVIKTFCYTFIIGVGVTMIYDYVYPGAVAYQRTVNGIRHFKPTENGIAGIGMPMVRIHNQYNSFICSGTIISSSHILTAAHCLLDENKKMSTENYNIHILDKDGNTVVVELAKAASLNNLVDYAIMSGNFAGYSTYKIAYDEINPIDTSNNLVTCGYPWGAKAVCYKVTAPLKSYYFRSSTEGHLFPGMSGGPVFDLDRKHIIAVNSAVLGDRIIVSPLVGLFESLEIEVDSE